MNETGVLDGNVLEKGKYDNNTIGSEGINSSDTGAGQLKGVNKISAIRALDIIQNSFQTEEAKGLFNLSEDGITFNRIDIEVVSYWALMLENDESALLISYALLINDPFNTHVIEVIKKSEYLSEYGRGTPNKGRWLKTGKEVDLNHSGGFKDQAYFDEKIVTYGGDGYYVVVIMDAEEPLQFTYSDEIDRPSLPGELMAHEFGHGFGQKYGDDNYQIDTSVQMGNIYLRINGFQYYRTNHGAAPNSDGFAPNAIPQHVKTIHYLIFPN